MAFDFELWTSKFCLRQIEKNVPSFKTVESFNNEINYDEHEGLLNINKLKKEEA